MKKLIPLIVGLTPFFTHASDIATLAEGCDALRNSAKKSQCFAALSRISSKAPSSPVRKSSAPDIIQQAQSRVRQMLLDPESARFEGAIATANKSVCGIVSAKNTLGGYAQPRRYIVTSEAVRIEDSDTWKMDLRWAEECE